MTPHTNAGCGEGAITGNSLCGEHFTSTSSVENTPSALVHSSTPAFVLRNANFDNGT